MTFGWWIAGYHPATLPRREGSDVFPHCPSEKDSVYKFSRRRALRTFLLNFVAHDSQEEHQADYQEQERGTHAPVHMVPTEQYSLWTSQKVSDSYQAPGLLWLMDYGRLLLTGPVILCRLINTRLLRRTFTNWSNNDKPPCTNSFYKNNLRLNVRRGPHHRAATRCSTPHTQKARRKSGRSA